MHTRGCTSLAPPHYAHPHLPAHPPLQGEGCGRRGGTQAYGECVCSYIQHVQQGGALSLAIPDPFKQEPSNTYSLHYYSIKCWQGGLHQHTDNSHCPPLNPPPPAPLSAAPPQHLPHPLCGPPHFARAQAAAHRTLRPGEVAAGYRSLGPYAYQAEEVMLLCYIRLIDYSNFM